jgi:hypothetical protein
MFLLPIYRSFLQVQLFSVLHCYHMAKLPFRCLEELLKIFPELTSRALLP